MKAEKVLHEKTMSEITVKKSDSTDIVKIAGKSLNSAFKSESAIFNFLRKHMNGEVKEYMEAKETNEQKREIVRYCISNGLFNVFKSWHDGTNDKGKQRYQRAPSTPRMFIDRMLRMSTETYKQCDSEQKINEQSLRKLLDIKTPKTKPQPKSKKKPQPKSSKKEPVTV